MTLVRSQIKNMFGGETAKLRGKNKVKCRTSSKRVSLVCNIVTVWTARLLVLRL